MGALPTDAVVDILALSDTFATFFSLLLGALESVAASADSMVFASSEAVALLDWEVVAAESSPYFPAGGVAAICVTFVAPSGSEPTAVTALVGATRAERFQGPAAPLSPLADDLGSFGFIVNATHERTKALASLLETSPPDDPVSFELHLHVLEDGFGGNDFSGRSGFGYADTSGTSEAAVGQGSDVHVHILPSAIPASTCVAGERHDVIAGFD